MKKGAALAAGMATLRASSYANILGANDRLHVAVVGVHGRGQALLRAAANVDKCQIRYICDVDRQSGEKGVALAVEAGSKKAQLEGDIRRLLEYKDLDAILVATPDHWHAPMTLMGVQAGKHVYVEKPCSHNPHEGELLVEAQRKYSRVIQMGNQQRSAPTSMEAIRLIGEGRIGKPYLGKAWYANTRGPIGKGKPAAVPDWLDYDLWQGPAPRQPYRDNLIHYNWHWFWHYGTGESCNNGTHEIDICRWALGVDYPTKVSSSGGRFHYDDDWEFYDTQTINYEFEGGKYIVWEGLSCNGQKTMGRDRGALIIGTEGSILIDRGGYVLYDKSGKQVQEEKESGQNATTDILGIGDMDTFHMRNFAAAIREGAVQHSPILEGHKSVLLCHLGNIAQKTGSTLRTRPSDGYILDNSEAAAMWRRTYEPGWEMVV